MFVNNCLHFTEYIFLHDLAVEHVHEYEMVSFEWKSITLICKRTFNTIIFNINFQISKHLFSFKGFWTKFFSQEKMQREKAETVFHSFFLLHRCLFLGRIWRCFILFYVSMICCFLCVCVCVLFKQAKVREKEVWNCLYFLLFCPFLYLSLFLFVCILWQTATIARKRNINGGDL